MNTFLQSYRLALTPLSPIHIGCGEDFEPTNYVIEDGILYGFDPSRAALNDLQQSKLMDAANRTSLMAIQRFFRDNATAFKAQADVLIPVSGGVAQQYEQRIGRAANQEASGNTVFNQLFIERASHTGTAQQPYIPGSSFKGAIRTAWLDELNGGKKPNDVQFTFKGEARSTSAMETRLLQGDFATSPLRLLKVADLMPNVDPARRVLYAVNLKKRKITKDGQEVQPKGIAARKECILHGQYRAFVADAVVQSLEPHCEAKFTPSLRTNDLHTIAQYSNRYHLTRLRRELAVLDGRGLLDPQWKRSLELLLAGELGQGLESGHAFLIRLGRYGGADSKTLSGEDVAHIKIMGAKGQPPTFESTTKTVWLAAEYEREHEHEQKHLLPFGWAIVEIDPQGDLSELKEWCNDQSKGRPDMAARRRALEGERAAAQQRKAEQAAAAAAKWAAEQAELLAQAERAAALAAMSAQAKAIETLRQQCEDWAAKLPPNGNFKKQVYSAGNPGALYLEAAKLVKTATEGTDWGAADKCALADVLEKWLPQVVAPWDAKEQRKKLKLAALRGLAP